MNSIIALGMPGVAGVLSIFVGFPAERKNRITGNDKLAVIKSIIIGSLGGENPRGKSRDTGKTKDSRNRYYVQDLGK